MGNMTIAVVFVATLNLLLILSQISALEINEDGQVITCYNETGTLFSTVKTNGALNENASSFKDNLPVSSLIEPTSGNPFTDISSAFKGWISDNIGLQYAKAIIYTPYNTARCLNLGEKFASTFAAWWYIITFGIIIMFFFGRD